MKEDKCDSCGEIIAETYNKSTTFCELCIGVFANCDHDCTSNCRREGCNCDCGEYHVQTKI